MRFLSGAEGGENRGGRQHEHEPILVARPCHEREESDANGDEQAGEEDPAGRNVPGGRLSRVGAERRGRHRLSDADSERHDTRFAMSVVRDNRPAHGVGAVSQAAA